ncbi:hypothetical protein EBX31_10030 [bacterium]|nr:hypothetical protein [bacterium]
MALGWLLAAGFLQAEPPMDLDSPFPKVALVKGKTGEVEKREIKQARLVGGSVEMEKADGGVAIFPLQDVLAILPLLPKADGPYTVEQTEGAIRLYQRMAPDVLQRASMDITPIQEWKQFRDRLLEEKKQKEATDRKEKEAKEAEDRKQQAANEAKAKANLKKEIQEWLLQAGEFRMSRTEKELTELKNKGESLARKSPEQMDVILEALAVLSQAQPKEKGEPLPDLQKLNEVQPRLVPDDLLGWLTGGVLILSFFGLLFGLAFLSSSLTRFKEGALLGGIVFGAAALGLLGILILTWIPAQVTEHRIDPRMDPKMEELSSYLKNKAKPVYYFPAKEFSFPVEEWRSWVLGYLPVSEESTGLFKVKMKKGTLGLSTNTWIWQQPLTALGIPLPLNLTFEGENPDTKSWQAPSISKVHLGRWLLPDSVAGLLKDSAINIWQQGLSSAGLAGVKLEKNDQGMILISVPVAGVKPKYELTKLEEPKAEEPKVKVEEPKGEPWKEVIMRKEISAEDMAGVFMQIREFDLDKLKEFAQLIEGRFYIIHGIVEGVGGNNFSSRGKMGTDTTDDIYLLGQKDYYRRGGASKAGSDTRQHLLVRCIIKTDWIFEKDSRKDLYAREVIQEFEQFTKGPRQKPAEIKFKTITGQEVTSTSIDPAKETPFIQRGKRLRFKKPLRIEVNLKDFQLIEEGKELPAVKGDGIKKIPLTDSSGDVEFYGLTLAPGGKISDVMEEVDADYKPTDE